MRLSLVVLTAGKSQGKVIPITRPEFVIGRDQQCHLRPASALISQRHCAVLARDERVFVQDFNSTNGTFVNGRQIKGQFELLDGDRLKVGPLEFRVQAESAAAAPRPAPPAKVLDRPRSEEEIAAALLALDDQGPQPGSPGVDEEGVPTGSTVFEGVPPPAADATADRPAPAKPAPSDTSSAAREVLDQYLQRHEMQKIRGSDPGKKKGK